MIAPVAEVTEVVREVLNDSEIELRDATSFDEIQGWDPMDLVSVVVEVECRFGVQFDLPEIDRLRTVGDLVCMIEAKQALAGV